jgi:hypothetical protein
MKRAAPKRGDREFSPRRVAMSVFFGAATSIGSAQVSATPAKPHTRLQSAEPDSKTVSPPAKVSLKDGVLAVDAHGADLDQILETVAHACGMLIEGAVKPVRVFGSYGPGDPQAILSDLLVGLGYNVMMVGVTPEGAPRKLILSERTGPASPPSSAGPSAPYRPETKPGQNDTEPPLPPGAIAHPRPEPPEDVDERRKQNMQRLQQRYPQPPQ